MLGDLIAGFDSQDSVVRSGVASDLRELRRGWDAVVVASLIDVFEADADIPVW